MLLIDQKNDLLEQINLVDDPANANIQADLEQRVLSHMAATGDDWESEMPWPPKDFNSHKDADIQLIEDIHPRAILVP